MIIKSEMLLAFKNHEKQRILRHLQNNALVNRHLHDVITRYDFFTSDVDE